MQVTGFLGKSLFGQTHFLESCRMLKVLDAVYSTPEVRVLISSGAQVTDSSLGRR